MTAFLSVLPLIAAIAVLAYTMLNFDRLRAPPAGVVQAAPLPDHLTVDHIGEIEKGLANLIRVIVIADHVERPTDKLSDAVEHNFSRGVKYLFLVSGSHARREVDGYYQIFEALAKIVISRSGTRQSVRDLVDIHQLPYDWNDYPYLFYQVQDRSEKPEALRTIAFRGEELREGIAKTYVRVEPTAAHTIAKSVLAEAPRPLQVPVELGQFEAAEGPIKLESTTAQGKVQQTIQ